MDLSVLIPSRNEEWLSRTVEGVLENIEADTECVVILDGAWADPPLRSHPRLKIVHHDSIGQRAATNQAARLSKAKYLMKLDAHCIMDKGFDRKLIEDYQEGWLLIPTQYNLYAFDRVCKDCGHEAYQGPIRCEKCRSSNVERKIVWQPRMGQVIDGKNMGHRKTESWRFDSDLHFQYWGNFTNRPEGQGAIHDTMSLLGACWFQSRKRYWELGGLDENHGSWGQMGTELSLKNWLSGGAVKVTQKTWFSHLFRTQDGFGFPYPNPGIHRAREYSQDFWRNNRYEKAIHPLSWLLEKFWPIDGWTEADLQAQKEREKGIQIKAKPIKKGVVYYTHNQLDPVIAQTARDVLSRSINGHSIVSVSLEPIQFGRNIVLKLEKGYLTYLQQILAGLESSDADVVFLCEHDVLYNSSHFQFTPPRKDRYYYNLNVWKVRPEDGHALHYDCMQVSGLCAYRDLLVQHYRKRIERYVKDGNRYDRKIGYEPGMRPPPQGIDEYGYETWWSDVPLVDIRVGGTMSKTRWSQDQFRNKKTCQNWIEADEIPSWGKTKGRFEEFIRDLRA